MAEIFSRTEELHGKKHVNYIGDGDSKTYNKIVEQISPEVKKKECVNHVEKRMGTKLRNCKKTKSLGGKGKLIAKLIKELIIYYDLAIHRHYDSLEHMRKAIWATFLHKCSTDEKPQHENCPTGEDSWCSWQKASTTGTLNNYKHKPALSADVAEAIKPIYEDLSRNNLLERCLGTFNQNNNKSLNNVIWKFTPKSFFNGTSIVEIIANLGIILFNDGHVALLDVLELLEVEIDQTVHDYCHDKERVSKAERQARRQGHLRACGNFGDEIMDEDETMDDKELLYDPGIAE